RVSRRSRRRPRRPYTTLFRSWYFRHRTPSPVYFLERHKGGIAAALVGVVLAVVLYVMVLLPWLSGVIAQQLPVTVEQHLGEYSRSEEHTAELQSRENLVCRLL